MTPCWTPDPDMPGTAKPLYGKEVDDAISQGLPIYATLAGCVLYESVQATAFERPLTAEDTWSGSRIIANDMRTTNLAPDGRRAHYRIVATPGVRAPFSPPLWPPRG